MQFKNSDKRYAVLSFLYLSVFWFTASKSCHAFDSWCFSEWAKHIYQNGIGYVYDSGSDYLPLFHLMLKVYVSMQPAVEKIASNIHYLKVFCLIFLLITGYFMKRIFEDSGISQGNLIYNVLFFLLNVAVLYNTLIWNQVDVILGAFVFISAYFAIKRQTFWSLLFLLLGLNFKLHAIIFIPLIGLMVLPDVVRDIRSGRILLHILLLAAIQLLILLPFILAGTVHRVGEVALAAVDKYPLISNYAYNVWYFVGGYDAPRINDNLLFLGITYKNWGLLMFFLSSGIALFPLMKQCYYRLFSQKNYEVSVDRILLIFALIPLLFFYFNTQMHERYSHPAMAFLIAWCVLKRQPVPAITGCLAYLLNLEDELKFLELHNYNTLIFDPVFISLIYLFTISWLYIGLFRQPANKAVAA